MLYRSPSSVLGSLLGGRCCNWSSCSNQEQLPYQQLGTQLRHADFCRCVQIACRQRRQRANSVQTVCRQCADFVQICTHACLKLALFALRGAPPGGLAYSNSAQMTKHAPTTSSVVGAGPKLSNGARTPVSTMAPAVANPFHMLSAYFITRATSNPPTPFTTTTLRVGSGEGWVGGAWGQHGGRGEPVLPATRGDTKRSGGQDWRLLGDTRWTRRRVGRGEHRAASGQDEPGLHPHVLHSKPCVGAASTRSIPPSPLCSRASSMLLGMVHAQSCIFRCQRVLVAAGAAPGPSKPSFRLAAANSRLHWTGSG